MPIQFYFTKTIKVNVHKYNLLILEVDMCFLTTNILKLFLAIIQSSVFIKYFYFSTIKNIKYTKYTHDFGFHNDQKHGSMMVELKL